MYDTKGVAKKTSLRRVVKDGVDFGVSVVGGGFVVGGGSMGRGMGGG